MVDIVITITEYGKKAAGDITGAGLKYKTICKLNQQTTMSSKEIASTMGITPAKAKRLVSELIIEGKAREI